MERFHYTIQDALGIHARPAGMLVKAVKASDCNVTIEKEGHIADASKLFAVMGLGVKQGDTITVTCEGDHEAETADALASFLKENL